MKSKLNDNCDLFHHTFSEVTHGAIEVWTKLPDEIRLDPSLAHFQRRHQRINSKLNYFVRSFHSSICYITKYLLTYELNQQKFR